MVIKEYSLSDLAQLVLSGDFWRGEVIPITKHRALAQIRNPRVRPEDVTLLVAYDGDRICGYIRVPVLGAGRSFGGCLPTWNEKKDICLLFSGEKFADQTDIDALRTRGHKFAADDASYLVRLYEDMGCGFLERLNGWFSGILVDVRKQKLVLFNDRYRVNRIYHHEDAHRFYFSSEAKSLKILPEDLLPALHQLIFCETCRAEALQLRAD